MPIPSHARCRLTLPATPSPLPTQVDNLNAAIDLRILYHIVTKNINFAMEVTNRTRQDVQGGALVGYEGKPRLLEASQVPSEHADDFKSLKKFPNWCTNNLWVSLKEIKAALAGNTLCPPIIVNERNIQPGEGGSGEGGSGGGGGAGGGGGGGGAGIPVLELETAAGAAIEFFSNSVGIHVPRMRFLPVKNTGDLFAVQSNLFDIRHGILHISPARSIPTPPIIRLGPEFASLEAFLERVHCGGALPCILEADHITITGNVWLGKGVVMRGSVVIVAAEGSRIDIPSKSELENVVVTGSLRLLGT
jgi:UTP--glucose-1-phosphate uridylyltransferase